nr:hypothetical protein [Tanacetum cinerariifolium]
KLVKTLLKGHSTLSLEDSLSGYMQLEAKCIRWIHNEKLVKILLKGHSTLLLEDSLSGDYDVKKNESGYELRLVAGIATSVLVNGGSQSAVPTQVKVVAYRY